MELWRKKVQERCEKCAGTIRKSEKKTQNLPHCGSASGNSGRLCVLFWRFWQRDVTEGTLVKEIQGTDADTFALYNERILNTAAPGGHTYGWQ